MIKERFDTNPVPLVLPIGAGDIFTVDKLLFLHIMNRNNGAKAALLDWNGLGKNKQRIIDFLTTTNLEIIKL